MITERGITLPSTLAKKKGGFQDLRVKNSYPIYKSNSGVCLSICGDKQGRAGQGQGRVARADTHPLDLLAARNNRLGGLFILIQ